MPLFATNMLAISRQATRRSRHRGDCFSASHAVRRCLSSSAWSVHSDTGIVSHNNKARYQTRIGLEIHAQLDISTKLFSPAKVSKSLMQPPNTLVHPFDVAVPGILPVCSQEAVQAAVLTAAALQCDIASISRFERKHYHYADLPFGYQVTQQRWPIARNGVLQSVGIDRIQLEQDTGKTITTTQLEEKHGSTVEVQSSLVDFNRAGCALIEIVMNPDILSCRQAAETVETLRKLLRHIGTCNGRMEEGSLRVDLNVSIHPIIDDDTDGDDNDNDSTFQPNINNRVEVKNLNSLRQVQQAAEYEALRQAKIIDKHPNSTFQETRTFHVKSAKTVLIRTKEGEEDYRFMPEPDLPPVILNEKVLGGNTLEEFLAQNLPELPEAARARLEQQYNLDEYTAAVIAGDPQAIQILDIAIQTAKDNLPDSKWKLIAKTVAKILSNDLFSLIREDEERRHNLQQGTATHENIEDVPYSTVNGQQLGELVALLLEGSISTTMATKLLTILFQEEIDKSPRDVAEERDIQLLADPVLLRELCHETIAKFPDQLAQYQKGDKHVTKMKKFFVGKAMAHCRGNAHPERLHEALAHVLEELAPGIQ